jgi:predicted phosphodiesterase
MAKGDELATELCRRFPDAGNRTLAKRLNDEHPAIFPTIERARNVVRYCRGAIGDDNRKQTKGRDTVRPLRKAGERPKLPKSQATSMAQHRLACRRALILGDIHLPFQDNDALELAFEYGEEYKPDLILLNGDLFDFYQLSKFKKDPTVSSLKSEIEAGKKFFDRLRNHFPDVRIVFRYGNHDRRFDDHLMACAPLIWEALPSLKDCWHPDAGIIEHRIEVIREQCQIMLGKLLVLHGDELPRGMQSPVNAARGVFIKTFVPVYVGHFHQESKQPAKLPNGKRIMSWSSGCLCGLSPAYLPINQWSTGFGTVTVEPNGKYRVTQLSIIDGEIY